MHRHLLRVFSTFSRQRLEQLRSEAATRPVLQALIFETLLSRLPPGDPAVTLPPELGRRLTACSPAVEPRAALQSNHALHAAWSRLFRANIIEHRPLPSPRQSKLPLLYPELKPRAAERRPHPARDTAGSRPPATPWKRPGIFRSGGLKICRT